MQASDSGRFNAFGFPTEVPALSRDDSDVALGEADVLPPNCLLVLSMLKETTREPITWAMCAWSV
jgi:hypothetical protein